MKLLFSVPSGYHLRELVLPLRRHLEANNDIAEVYVVTPAAPIAGSIFQEFGVKFFYHENPKNDDGYRELFKKIQPDRVITNTVGHDSLDEPILRIAKEMGIATVTFIASWDNVWKIERLLQSKIPIYLADRFIVWNSMMKNHLMRIFPDIAEERIAVIGAPRLDYFSQKEHITSKEDVYKQFGFPDITRPFIHIATTELYPMEYIVKAIRKNTDSGIIPNNPYLYASVHPGGSLEKYKSFEQYGVSVRFSSGRREEISLPSFRYAPREADIFFLLGVFTHASVLVNHSSTVALESLITGVPVVNVTYGKTFDWWNWRRSMVYRDFQQHYNDLVSDNATYIATSKKELVTSIINASNNPHAKDPERAITVKKMITTTDGTTSKQVLDFIMAL
ncbi:MAG TPA: hypothetical protein VJI96_04420 [Candidatus Andersenbacteria bacterium]|nr:hypothetical protein [Candidatus Andersenbacteria bacterium]